MENFLVDPGRVGLPISSLQMRRSTTELRALMVRVEGIEPSTSSLSERRSTSELHAQDK